MQFTPDGKRVISGGSSGEITMWNALTFNFESILQAHDSAIRRMKWTEDGCWLLTGDATGYIKYWQSNLNNIKTFQAHADCVRGISMAPTGEKFATCSDDASVVVWDFDRIQKDREYKSE